MAWLPDVPPADCVCFFEHFSRWLDCVSGGHVVREHIALGSSWDRDWRGPSPPLTSAGRHVCIGSVNQCSHPHTEEYGGAKESGRGDEEMDIRSVAASQMGGGSWQRDENGGCYFWALTALMGGDGCVASGFLTITVLLYIDTDFEPWAHSTNMTISAIYFYLFLFLIPVPENWFE